MKNDKFHIYLSDAERTQVIQTLIELKNSLLEQGKYTDAVDDVLLKFTKAKRKHLQVHYILLKVINILPMMRMATRAFILRVESTEEPS